MVVVANERDRQGQMDHVQRAKEPKKLDLLGRKAYSMGVGRAPILHSNPASIAGSL